MLFLVSLILILVLVGVFIGWLLDKSRKEKDKTSK